MLWDNNTLYRKHEWQGADSLLALLFLTNNKKICLYVSYFEEKV